MKIKVKNISGVEKAIQLDGFNYTTVKPGDIVERNLDEKNIPEGWELVGKEAPVTTGKPRGRNAATVITENNQNPTSNDGVITSGAITGLK